MNEVKLLAAGVIVLAPLCLWSWHREPPSSVNEGVHVLPPGMGSLSAVRWESESSTVSVNKEGEHWWFELRREGAPAESFVGNDEVQDWAKSMTRPKALRSLGDIVPKDRERLGLDEPCPQLTLSFEETKNVRFRMCPFPRDPKTPARRYYMEREGQDSVYLMSPRLFAQLYRPDRFKQRTFMDVPMHQVASASLAYRDQTVSLVQKNRSAGPDARWVLADAPDGDAPGVMPLMRMLGRMTVRSYPTPSESADPWLEVVYTGPDGEELERVAMATSEEAGGLLVRSSRTGRWATVPDVFSRRLAEHLPRVFPNSPPPPLPASKPEP